MAESESPTLLDYGAKIWRRKFLVLAIVVGMGAAATAISSLQRPTYLAESDIVLAQQQLDSSFNLQLQELSPRQMDTQIALFKGDAVAQRLSTKGVTATLSVSATGDSNVVKVTALDTDPQRAADGANAYVDSYQEVSAEIVAKTLDDAETQLKDRMALLQKQIDPLINQLNAAIGGDRQNTLVAVNGLLNGLQQQQAALQAQLSRIAVQRSLTQGATVVVRAVPPSKAVSPKPLLDGALAAVLGLLIGASIAVILDMRRRPAPAAGATARGEEPSASDATQGVPRGPATAGPHYRQAPIDQPMSVNRTGLDDPTTAMPRVGAPLAPTGRASGTPSPSGPPGHRG